MKAASQRAWLQRLARETDRERLERARQRVRDARAAKRSARARARDACRSAREALRVWAAEQRQRVRDEVARLRDELRVAIAEQRARVRECCGPDRERVRLEHDARIVEARAELEALQGERRRERAWRDTNPLGRKLTDRERLERLRAKRSESDDAVRANLDAAQLIVWERVKRRIRASEYMSRTEAFLQWLAEHPDETAEILADDAEREYREALKAEHLERAALAKAGRRTERETVDYLRAELDAVPF